PAALASALKRIPQAPSLTEAPAAPAGDTAPSPAAAMTAEPEPAATPEVVQAPEPEPEPTAAPTVAESVATVADASTSSNGMQESDEVAHAPGVATAVAEPEPKADVEQASVEAAVAEAPEVPAHTHEAVAEATTQVLVTGLTSFGAITSFKQALERVDGVSRVSLGLGTSGEF